MREDEDERDTPYEWILASLSISISEGVSIYPPLDYGSN